VVRGRLRHFSFQLSALSFLLSIPSFAQDSLLLSIQNQNTADAHKREMENQPYTVRWGELKLQAGASLAGEWNDNVNLSHVSPQEDFIVRPMGNLDAFWPVTDVNALNFSIGVGYEKYLRHDDYDYVVVSPGSQLSWDIKVKDFKINFHDQFWYYEDPTVYGAVSGVARFGGFNNTAGIMGTWDLHDVILSLGYDHFNFIPSSSTYEYLRRASDFALFRAAFQVHPSANVGIEASGGPSEYNQPVLQNNFTYSLGAFAQWQATDHISLQPRGGYYAYNFSSLGLLPSSEQNGYYFSLNFKHDLRRNINYSVEVGHEAFFGIYSSLTDQWYGTASINWRIIQYLSATTGFRYETATQPLDLQLSDNYNRMSVDFRLSCPIKKKLTASLEYRYYLKRDAVIESQDYEQNRFILQLAYTF
jgi:hypothetical protein